MQGNGVTDKMQMCLTNPILTFCVVRQKNIDWQSLTLVLQQACEVNVLQPRGNIFLDGPHKRLVYDL